jgi:phage gp36-like protein
MAMRDLRRLEKLSSATGLGLWAEDVILALDRVTRVGERQEEDLQLLTDAAEILDSALGRSEHPFSMPGPVGAVAPSDTALDVAENLSEDGTSEQAQAVLREVIASLRDVADGSTASAERIGPAIDFFTAVGRHQLAAGNSVAGQSGGAGSWIVNPVMSSFS